MPHCLSSLCTSIVTDASLRQALPPSSRLHSPVHSDAKNSRQDERKREWSREGGNDQWAWRVRETEVGGSAKVVRCSGEAHQSKTTFVEFTVQRLEWQ